MGEQESRCRPRELRVIEEGKREVREAGASREYHNNITSDVDLVWECAAKMKCDESGRREQQLELGG